MRRHLAVILVGVPLLAPGFTKPGVSLNLHGGEEGGKQERERENLHVKNAYFDSVVNWKVVRRCSSVKRLSRMMGALCWYFICLWTISTLSELDTEQPYFMVV